MRLFIVIFLLLPLASCLDTPPCIDPGTSRLAIEFKSVTDGTPKSIFVDSVYILDDYILIEKEVDISSTEVPFYPDRENSLIVIQSVELEDSISINYTSTPKLYAADCDVELIFEDFTLNYTTADSTRLLFEETPPRIEIYF